MNQDLTQNLTIDIDALITQERERLTEARDTLARQHEEIEDKIAAYNRELSALNAYEAVKRGSTATPRILALSPPAAAPAPKRGSVRDTVLGLIRNVDNGLNRREILERLGVKGDKSGEMSISNALTSLIKKQQVRRVSHAGHHGKYVAVQ